MTTPPLPPGAAFHTVLLDIDGTLIDSNDAHARAWVESLRAHGYTIPFERIRPLIGMGGDKILPDVAGLDPESGEAERMGETRSRYFLERELPSLRPTRGARALLEHMRAEGLELVVATSANASDVRATLEQAGVADLIQAASTADDAKRSKPDPDIVRAALGKAGRPASQSAMLGDTPYDIEAATRVRVPIIALRSGGGWDDAALQGALAIYDDPADLLARWDESPLAVGVAKR